MTQIIITKGKYKFRSVCMKHEGSKKLKELIEEE